MSSNAWAWFISASSFAVLGVPIAMQYKGIMRHYTLQALVAVQSTVLSFVHHICFETKIDMCLGQMSAATQALDIMFAFLLLALMVAPFIECWAKDYGRWWRERYELSMGTLTTVMVAVRADNIETFLVVCLPAGLAFFWVAYRELVRHRIANLEAGRKSFSLAHVEWNWQAVVVCTVISAIGLIVSYGLSRSNLLSYGENRDSHGFFHVFAGITPTLAVLLLPDYKDLPAYLPDPVFEPRNQLKTGAKAAPSAANSNSKVPYQKVNC